VVFFIILPDGWKSIYKAALRSIGLQSDKKVLKYHMSMQLIVTLFLTYTISFFSDLNLVAFAISKFFFEIIMALIYYLTQSEADWSDRALLARSRLESDLPPEAEFTPGKGPRLSPIDKNSGGNRGSLNQEDVNEFIAYLGPSNDQNCCQPHPSPRGSALK